MVGEQIGLLLSLVWSRATFRPSLSIVDRVRCTGRFSCERSRPAVRDVPRLLVVGSHVKV